MKEKICPECGTVIKEGRAGKCRKCYERRISFEADNYLKNMAGGR